MRKFEGSLSTTIEDSHDDRMNDVSGVSETRARNPKFGGEDFGQESSMTSTTGESDPGETQCPNDSRTGTVKTSKQI